MRFLRPPATPIDKSRTTLYSVSSSTMVNGSGGGGSSSNRTQTTASSSSDSNNNLDDEDDGIESLNRSMNGCGGSGGSGGSDGRETASSLDDDDDDDNGSYNECDITLIDDDDILCDAKTDGEMLYCQVVELLRFELEVCCIDPLYNMQIHFEINGK